MHLLGLLGMPRRVYTYPPGFGWTFLNALESIGSYVLAIGLVLIVVNLTVSLFRGAAAGNDPWTGDTLEWATSSPPPPYNYPVIPTVSSPYAMWDKEDRELDNRRLERGEGLLERGHETPASTVQDAEWDEILAMPPHSVWPPVVGLTLFGMFTMLLLHHFEIAAAFLVVGGLALIRWHVPEASA
jgi:cytochrome c oxidase subunit 1/cytochrome c oxidase subunit I+III